MAHSVLILEPGGEYEFDFTDGIRSELREGFTIPAAQRSDQGERKRQRGETCGPPDYKLLNIPIDFMLLGATEDEMLANQQRLVKALNRPRNTLKWNPNPDRCQDVYFETFASPFEVPLNMWYLGFSDCVLDLLANPFPYPAPATIFDTVAILGQMDGESGEWTGNNFWEATWLYVQGSKSAHTASAAGTTWLQRAMVTALNLTQFRSPATSWITMWLYLDSVPAAMTKIRVSVQNSADLGWTYWDITAPYGEASFQPGWNALFFDFNNPTYQDSDYLDHGYTITNRMKIEAIVTSGNGPAFNVDNVHIVNGKVFNVRGQMPLGTVVYGMPGEFECGFEMDLRAGDQKVLCGPENEHSEWSLSLGDSMSFATEGDFAGFIPSSGTEALKIHRNLNSGSSAKATRNFAGSGVNLAHLATGKISFKFMVRNFPSGTATVTLSIGQNSTNCFTESTNVTAFYANEKWFTVSFDVASMSNVGTPSWNSLIDFMELYVGTGGPAGTAWDVYFDNVVIFEPGSNVDSLYLTRTEHAAEAATGLILDPLAAPAPSGHSWETIPTATTDANADGTVRHSYYRWSIGSTEKFVFPAKLTADKYKDDIRLLARLRTADASGGSVRWCGYDKNSNEWFFGDTVSVGYNAGHFQTVDLGSLSLPLDGFPRGFTPASNFTIIGLAITGTGTANWDVNVLNPLGIEGGARYFSPVVGKRFMSFDSCYFDSKGFAQGLSANVDDQSVQRRRTNGDLLALTPGTNSLFIDGSDSSAPDSASSIDITKLVAVARLKNGAT